jgi:hypothetical protein
MARSLLKQRRDAERQRIEAYEATLRRVFAAPRPAPDFENAIDEVKRGFVNDIVRPSHEWRPKLKTRDPGRLRLAAARHLFARYAVPAHLERIWIEPAGLEPAEAMLRKRWYVAAARGDSLYKAGASEWLNRKEVHAFLCARGDLRFEEAFWLAIAQGMSEDAALALRIARSRIAATPRAELGFWREVARFFCTHPTSREEIDDLCDYIAAARERDRRFSLKGRTLASLRRLSAEWHRDVAAVARIEAMRRRFSGPQAASETRWAGSRLQNWSWQPPGKGSPSSSPGPISHAADLAGPGADLVELGVAQQAAGRVVVDVAVAAEELDRVERHLRRLLGRIEDAAGGVLARGLAAVAGLRPRRRHRPWQALIVVYMSASLPCTSWNSPIGWPNCLRSWT